MSDFTVILPSGEAWVPQFVKEVNNDKCIGCGRCFKVCSRDVLSLMGVTEDGKLLAVDPDDDDDDEYEKKVMAISHPENCIGCEACAKICPRDCYTHGPAAV